MSTALLTFLIALPFAAYFALLVHETAHWAVARLWGLKATIHPIPHRHKGRTYFARTHVEGKPPRFFFAAPLLASLVLGVGTLIAWHGLKGRMGDANNIFAAMSVSHAVDVGWWVSGLFLNRKHLDANRFSDFDD